MYYFIRGIGHWQKGSNIAGAVSGGGFGIVPKIAPVMAVHDLTKFGPPQGLDA
jgi:hypothetical protein